MPFLNRMPIDRYIDSYWMIYCPDSYNIWDIDQSIRVLVNKILQFSDLYEEVDEEKQRMAHEKKKKEELEKEE